MKWPKFPSCRNWPICLKTRAHTQRRTHGLQYSNHPPLSSLSFFLLFCLFCLFVFLVFLVFLVLFSFLSFYLFVFFVFLSFCHHYHNHVSISTTTQIFVPIRQFFNFTTHFTTNHYQYCHPPPPPPRHFLYLRETQANVLRGLQRFWGGCKVLYLRETQANVCWLLVFSMPAEIFYFFISELRISERRSKSRSRSRTDNSVLGFWYSRVSFIFINLIVQLCTISHVVPFAIAMQNLL